MAEQDANKDTIEKPVGLNVRLARAGNADQPVLANFTRVNGAPGMVFVDFGFLEPAALEALSRLARSGGKIPETLNGKLAVRVASSKSCNRASARLRSELPSRVGEGLGVRDRVPQGSMGYDTLAMLHRQLGQVVAGLGKRNAGKSTKVGDRAGKKGQA
jgi:hypothetical protein